MGKYVVPVLVAFGITVLLGPITIKLLRRLKVGQTEREELKSHWKKEGTPTMGGILILLGIVVTSLFYVGDYPEIVPILLMTVGFGLIGFLDDFLKVVLRRSDGLLPWQKMLCQVVVTVIFILYLWKDSSGSPKMLVPFTGGFEDGFYLDLGWLAIPVMLLAIVGTVNGANLTDGVDGLADSVTLVIAVFFAIVSIVTGSGTWPIACAVAGALLGFLIFNAYPAHVFMGDTGSLALGGFVASIAYMMRMPIFILIVALVYWEEILSVILQVTYFKATGGKRIFRMAPLHHHFELGGWSEATIVAVFSIATVVLCLIALLGI